MMSEQPEIRFPLDLPNVKILKMETNKAGDYIITVESTLTSTHCRECGREIDEFHGYGRWIELRHLPILDHKVWIRYRPKRYRCPDCDDHPTTTHQVSWHERNSPHTRGYDDYLMRCLINSTVMDVSRKQDVGYDAVEGALCRRIQAEVDWQAIDRIGTLGMDEIALRKGKRDFVLVVTARHANQVRILAVLPDRKKATARQFLESIPKHLHHTIEALCSDMWEGYINAAKEFRQAHDTLQFDIVVDRFHVAQTYRGAVDTLRKQERKRLKTELNDAQYEEIKGVMWATRKNNADLSDEQRQQLRRFFDYSPLFKQAYTLREELTAIFDLPLSHEQAQHRLDCWQVKVQQSGLTCFDKFLRTLNNWREEIVNYFKKRFNSGFVEGLNNKIKTIKRRCYGLTDIQHVFQRIFLDLEGFRLFA
jgi:transposase